MSKSIDGFFDGRSDEEIERIKDTLKVAFPPPREAPAAKAPRAAPKEMEPGAGQMFPRSLVEAQDTLWAARHLTDAIGLAALDLDEFQCGAICSVVHIVCAKITDSIELIESCKKELGGGAYLRKLETARNV